MICSSRLAIVEEGGSWSRSRRSAEALRRLDLLFKTFDLEVASQSWGAARRCGREVGRSQHWFFVFETLAWEELRGNSLVGFKSRTRWTRDHPDFVSSSAPVSVLLRCRIRYSYVLGFTRSVLGFAVEWEPLRAWEMSIANFSAPLFLLYRA